MWELNAGTRASHLFISLLYIVCLHVSASVTENNVHIYHIYHCVLPCRALGEGSTFFKGCLRIWLLLNSQR